ncbi:unannotated protein [freshwater metagenome]|uniref:Unannotated protein n=1 Tax=freshwater metagenome TaxID=449393 RepID=A0A6J6LTS4_9ZZZZ|nr:UDP-N-acetylmuramoyl-L-alanyl-D-glutamate--2,6-diaminopimelate ligase [Actinomycetota bacterium]MSY86843.1 UDP-N-acetylmuramoyl-L-alanyl-D-glutamate--2,6-diaminopimelate ligase [Actinomycetota bacterium]
MSAKLESLRSIIGFLGVSPGGFSTAELDISVRGVSVESSKISNGDIFVAMPGAHTHGAHFAADAISRGAVALITDAEGAGIANAAIPVVQIENIRAKVGELSAFVYGNPSSSMCVVAVTGTNGKTTTTSLLEYLWSGSGLPAGVIGTLGARYHTQGKTVSLPSARTTPEASELQKNLALMRDSGVQVVAMEVSSHALSLHRVDGIYFELSLFTNLTQDHLDFHHTMEEYFLAKSALFTSKFSAGALVNADDSFGKRLLAQCEIPAISISTDKGDWQLSLTGFQLTRPGGAIHIIDSPLVGDFNRMNAAMALVAFVQTGGDIEVGIDLLRSFPGVPGRLEQVGNGSPLVLVDYAHTPDAVTRVLSSLRSHTRGRIIAVLGCGGNRDPLKRPEMGRALQAGADLAIATSDNPRSEDPAAILDSMCGEDFKGVRILDRREAISLAISQAADEDLVLIAGKGHEQGQEINGVITAFDDRQVALEMLAKRGQS